MSFCARHSGSHEKLPETLESFYFFLIRGDSAKLGNGPREFLVFLFGCEEIPQPVCCVVWLSTVGVGRANIGP